jgi:transketolase
MRNLSEDYLSNIATLVRYYILRMTTRAESGHPTTSLSAADLVTTLFATTYRFDFDHPANPNNDRLIFSKGHASPLYYALFAACGILKPSDIDKYRTFDSVLEGHPTPRFRYTEAAAGSLGQGLSIGVGMALALRAKFKIQNAKGKNMTSPLPSPTRRGGLSSPLLKGEDQGEVLLPRVFVLLGDGEMAEGSVWEAIEIASHYQLDNLVGIIDVNRLGQSDETMLGYAVTTYKRRVEAFGWDAVVINGHDFKEILSAFEDIDKKRNKPYMIIAKTIKGKGVSFLEDKNGWHGKTLAQEDFEKAVKELGAIDFKQKISVPKPTTYYSSSNPDLVVEPREVAVEVSFSTLRQRADRSNSNLPYKIGDSVATRKAYGEALAQLGELYPEIVALDGDTKNSTFSEIFKARFPERFFEMYIAEQNMVGSAIGMSKMGYIPFASTFAAFFTRTYDQIRMGAISRANVKLVGSHAGVSIGEDGPSQMGLEDLSMFRAVQGSTVLYPCDAVSTSRLVEEMVERPGIVYMRTSRPATPVIYDNDEKFPIGGSKVHKVKTSPSPSPTRRGEMPFPLLKGEDQGEVKAVIVGAGVTLHEALKAQNMLAEEGINTVVIDCYSIKPIDAKTIKQLGDEAGLIITVEDHWFDGGLGDAVLNIFANDEKKPRIIKLAVKEMPRSGKSTELMSWAGIDAAAIVKTVINP